MSDNDKSDISVLGETNIVPQEILLAIELDVPRADIAGVAHAPKRAAKRRALRDKAE